MYTAVVGFDNNSCAVHDERGRKIHKYMHKYTYYNIKTIYAYSVRVLWQAASIFIYILYSSQSGRHMCSAYKPPRSRYITYRIIKMLRHEKQRKSGRHYI